MRTMYPSTRPADSPSRGREGFAQAGQPCAEADAENAATDPARTTTTHMGFMDGSSYQDQTPGEGPYSGKGGSLKPIWVLVVLAGSVAAISASASAQG